MDPYQRAVRSPNRRGKWHLLRSALPTRVERTICDRPARDWDEADRTSLDPRQICTHCLRDTP